MSDECIDCGKEDKTFTTSDGKCRCLNCGLDYIRGLKKETLQKFINHLKNEGFVICDTNDTDNYYPDVNCNFDASIERFIKGRK